MATVRTGEQTVLLIVDVQVRVMAQAWDAPRVIANVARLVARARVAGVPVVWVQHENPPEMARGSAGWQWVSELAPAPGEALVAKTFNSAFERTTLEATLAALGATHLVLAGAESAWCIRATAYGAIERGYDVTLVADAHSTAPHTLDDGRSVDAEGIVYDLNHTLRWLEYPGRRNAVARTEDVVFA